MLGLFSILLLLSESKASTLAPRTDPRKTAQDFRWQCSKVQNHPFLCRHSELAFRGGSDEDLPDDSAFVGVQLQEQKDNEVNLEQATTLRQKGKDLHDSGKWAEAALLFSRAAQLLVGSPEHSEEFCTCKLHEALCYLKNHDFQACVEVCSDVLALDVQATNAAIRARALHRRAKAYHQLEKENEALEDARSAAFLGDRKAVALYGKLMRRNSFSEIKGAASPPILRDLLAGKDPFLQQGSSDTNKLLESLWNKKSSPTDAADSPSLLGRGGTGGTFAKSLISSLTKRLESDSEQICQFLKRIDPTQLQNMAQLAGVPLKEHQAQIVVNFCHSVRPQGIKRTVKIVRRVWYAGGALRKAMKLMEKYRHLLVLCITLVWVRSALRRPLIPVHVAARETTRAAARKVAKDMTSKAVEETTRAAAL